VLVSDEAVQLWRRAVLAGLVQGARRTIGWQLRVQWRLKERLEVSGGESRPSRRSDRRVSERQRAVVSGSKEWAWSGVVWSAVGGVEWSGRKCTRRSFIFGGRGTPCTRTCTCTSPLAIRLCCCFLLLAVAAACCCPAAACCVPALSL
jgi:hypothetical protein